MYEKDSPPIRYEKVPQMKLWSGKKTDLVKPATESPLRRACHEFGRDDLYETLNMIISLKPRWIDTNLQPFLNDKRYVIAANAMLYESKVQQAKEYLQKAIRSVNQDSPRYHRLSTVLTNLDVVSRIARRSWELDGKLPISS